METLTRHSQVSILSRGKGVPHNISIISRFLARTSRQFRHNFSVLVAGRLYYHSVSPVGSPAEGDQIMGKKIEFDQMKLTNQPVDMNKKMTTKYDIFVSADNHSAAE